MDGIADTVTLERLVSSDLDLLAHLGSRLLSANTLLGAYAGWGYPDWFAPEGGEPKRDAEKVLNWICANNVPVPVDRCVYIQWLNERGRIEADLTVTRMAEGGFIGKEALLRHREAGVKHRLVQFLLEDPEPLLYYKKSSTGMESRLVASWRVAMGTH